MGEKKRRLAAGVTAGKGDDRIALEHAAKARAALAQSAFGPALEHLAIALERAPQLDALWAQFSDLIRFFNFRDPLPPRLRTLLERALEHPAVDPGDLVRPISSTALSRGDPFGEPLLLKLMQETVIRDPALENAIVAARRDPDTPLATLVAIAHQCFNTEYLLEETPAESLRLAALTVEASDHYACALYAAYRPLHTVTGSERIAQALTIRCIP